jgi:hypothetical protein
MEPRVVHRSNVRLVSVVEAFRTRKISVKNKGPHHHHRGAAGAGAPWRVGPRLWAFV